MGVPLIQSNLIKLFKIDACIKSLSFFGSRFLLVISSSLNRFDFLSRLFEFNDVVLLSFNLCIIIKLSFLSISGFNSRLLGLFLFSFASFRCLCLFLSGCAWFNLSRRAWLNLGWSLRLYLLSASLTFSRRVLDCTLGRSRLVMSNMPVVMVLLLFFIAITLFKLTALALLVLTKDSIFPVGFHLLHSLDFRQDFLGNRFRNPVVKHFLGELGQVLDVLTGGSKHNDMLSAQSHVLNRQLFVHLGVHFVGSVLVVFLASAQDIGVSHAPRVELVMLDALCYLQGIAVVALGENLNNAMLLGLVQLIPEITHEHRSVEVSNVNQILLFFYVFWCFLSSATTMYSLRLRNLDRLFYHISLTFHIHHDVWLLFLFLLLLLLCC